MKKLYVGLGGIGCRTLRTFEKESKPSDSVRFLYLDSDIYTGYDLPSDSFFCFENKELNKENFEWLTDNYFSDVYFDANKTELIFVTSSFGDFGSQNLFNIANFISSSIITSNLYRQFSVSIKALVFSHENFGSIFSETENKINELNTLKFVKEYRKRVVENADGTYAIDSTVYDNLDIFLLTVPETNKDEFFKMLTLSDNELEELCCKEIFFNVAESVDEHSQYDEENSEKLSDKIKDNGCLSNGYVFISYSSKKQSSADAMRNLLNKNNIKTWMAPYDIPAGSIYTEVINKAIKNCSCFVLLLTEAAQKSNWVPKEVERATNYSKHIIPIQLEIFILNDSFELLTSTNHIVAIKKIDDKSEDIKNLLNSIRISLEASGESPGSDTNQNKSSSQNPKKKLKIRNLILILCVLSALSGSVLGLLDQKTKLNDLNNELKVLEQEQFSDGNMVNDGLVFEKDGIIYYQNHDDNWYLYKEENGIDIRLNTDNTWCICSDGEYVYYANVDDGSSIYRIKPNGEGREKLNSDNCSNLIIDGEYIYYIDSNTNRNIFRMKKDGSEKQKIAESYVYDAAIYDGRIYAVSKDNIFSVATDGSQFGVICKEAGKDINLYSGKIIFINRENSKIYSMETDGSDLTEISDDKAAYLNVYTGYIYYQNLSAEGHLYSIELISGEKKQLVADDSRYINVTSDKIYYRMDKDTKNIYSVSLPNADILKNNTSTDSVETRKQYY